jgi:Family of unknown function (DUF5681)
MPRKGGVPENLIKVKKGDPSPNPKGRPKEMPELKKLFIEVMSEKFGSVGAIELMLRAIVKKAIKGDVRAFATIMDRVYGKAKQSIEQTNYSGGTIVQIISEKDLDESDLKR